VNKGGAMNKILTAVIIFLIVSISSFTSAEEVEICGFGAGEFAIKGAVERLTNELVIAPIENALKDAKNISLEITIIGYADSTGSASLNDEVALKRADQMKFVLNSKFPEAKIVAITKGDEENFRKVRVSWKIVNVVPEEDELHQQDMAQKRNYDGKLVIVLIAMILIIAMMLIYVFSPFFLKSVHSIKDMKTSTEQIKVKVNGMEFKFPLKTEWMPDEDKLFVLPFKSVSNPKKNICYKKRLDAIKSAKGCFKNQQYADQLEDLIEKGTIKIINT